MSTPSAGAPENSRARPLAPPSPRTPTTTPGAPHTPCSASDASNHVPRLIWVFFPSTLRPLCGSQVGARCRLRSPFVSWWKVVWHSLVDCDVFVCLMIGLFVYLAVCLLTYLFSRQLSTFCTISLFPFYLLFFIYLSARLRFSSLSSFSHFPFFHGFYSIILHLLSSSFSIYSSNYSFFLSFFSFFYLLHLPFSLFPQLPCLPLAAAGWRRPCECVPSVRGATASVSVPWRSALTLEQHLPSSVVWGRREMVSFTLLVFSFFFLVRVVVYLFVFV